MRRFYAYIASECTLYSVTDPCHSLQYYEESDRGHTKTGRKPDYIDEFTPNKTQEDIKVKSPLFIL